jgi:uncharacterized membrane protein
MIDPSPQTVPTRRPWYSPVAFARSLILRPRVLLGAIAGIAVMVLLPANTGMLRRWALAWDVGGLVYLALAFYLMSTCPAERMRRRAARADESGNVILVLILLAILSSGVAITGLLFGIKDAPAGAKLATLGVVGATIFISWTVMQVVFAIHYAHVHYAPARGERAGGLQFPDDPQPDYWDFLYFSTSIGASSQTSDVNIASKHLRRLVTLHAVMSFFFNTMVLAITINIAASLI